MYRKTIANVLLPEDFVDPVKPVKPPERTARSTSLAGGGTAHWRTEYKACLGESAKISRETGGFHRKMGFQIVHPPAACVGRSEDSTSYHDEFGRYGADPLMKIQPGSLKLPIKKTALTAGTTKGSEHIPGYQGYIPAQITSPESARAEQGATTRSVDKTIIVETYHTNLVGYCGHVPASARNDLGGRRNCEMTTMGKDYTTPRTYSGP
jgi:hypothetical protein